ncbi:MAG: hypothetical protein LBI53_07605 [Candidatus Peribacteria bacterium]|nr:hypothetical protein [Candidatus Peribacteria bacterium]
MDAQPINLSTILQYISFVGILVALHYHINIQYNITITILTIAILILLSQFLLYYKYFKRLPNIPLLADIWNGILK